MTTHEQWLALAQRCAESTGLDRNLDGDIYVLWFGDEDLRSIGYGLVRSVWMRNEHAAPEVTGSIDAIVSLIEKTLPGWWASADLTQCPHHQFETGFRGRIQGPRYIAQDYSVSGASPALALCRAYCIARAELAKEDRT